MDEDEIAEIDKLIEQAQSRLTWDPERSAANSLLAIAKMLRCVISHDPEMANSLLKVTSD